MKTKNSPDKFNNPFDDPYKNLAYNIIRRSLMDALGRKLELNGYERTREKRIEIINQAREYIHEDSADPLSFDDLCNFIGADPDVLRRRIPKEMHQSVSHRSMQSIKREVWKRHREQIYTNIQLSIFEGVN